MSTQPHLSVNEAEARTALRGLPLAADANRVGRTHRVVRERALAMQEARKQRRSLWLPLTIASSMLAMICYAIWTSVSQWDITDVPDEITNSFFDGSQMMILSLWFLPVTVTVLFFVWMRRNRTNGDSV